MWGREVEGRRVGKWRGDMWGSGGETCREGSGGETCREVEGRHVGKWRGDV